MASEIVKTGNTSVQTSTGEQNPPKAVITRGDITRLGFRSALLQSGLTMSVCKQRGLPVRSLRC